jgi:hypothetical protein
MVRRINVTYQIRAAADKRSVFERVLGFHAQACPLARRTCGCVAYDFSGVRRDLG